MREVSEDRFGCDGLAVGFVPTGNAGVGNISMTAYSNFRGVVEIQSSCFLYSRRYVLDGHHARW